MKSVYQVRAATNPLTVAVFPEKYCHIVQSCSSTPIYYRHPQAFTSAKGGNLIDLVVSVVAADPALACTLSIPHPISRVFLMSVRAPSHSRLVSLLELVQHILAVLKRLGGLPDAVLHVDVHIHKKNSISYSFFPDHCLTSEYPLTAHVRYSNKPKSRGAFKYSPNGLPASLSNQ